MRGNGALLMTPSEGEGSTSRDGVTRAAAARRVWSRDICLNEYPPVLSSASQSPVPTQCTASIAWPLLPWRGNDWRQDGIRSKQFVLCDTAAGRIDCNCRSAAGHGRASKCDCHGKGPQEVQSFAHWRLINFAIHRAALAKGVSGRYCLLSNGSDRT
jgi:hypothetical protein